MISTMNIDMQAVAKAAHAGGDIVRRYFGEVMKVEEKTNVRDLRTKADIESEQAIIAVLRQTFPALNIYAEESGTINNGSEYTFVVDPLDGTNNFVLGIPYFTISIGLLKNDEAIAGVIYNPILDQLYTAAKGKGAFMNGTPIHVNQEADITHCTVSYTCGYNTARAYSDRVKAKLYDIQVKRTLETWAPAYDYCLLASGRIEAVISKEGDMEDYVAAKVIVAEAGGKITGFNNEPVGGRAGDFVASNGTGAHQSFLALLD